MFKFLKKKKQNIGKFTEIHASSSVDRYSIVGDYTYIGKNCNVTKAKIGNYVSIANNVTIGAGEHILDRFSTSSWFYNDTYDELTKKDCIIEHDVWIGVDSIIRRGVVIGTGAVVGANSFVNKDVPPYAVVAGNPAKIIKYRFSEETIKKLLKSEWWLKNPDRAKKIAEKCF